MDGCSDPSKPSGDTICVLKASYGSYPVGGRGDLESDFGFVIYGTGVLAGLQAVTAKQIWRFEAAEKPSYGALKMLTCESSLSVSSHGGRNRPRQSVTRGVLSLLQPERRGSTSEAIGGDSGRSRDGRSG